jgi:hypothetical protein
MLCGKLLSWSGYIAQSPLPSIAAMQHYLTVRGFHSAGEELMQCGTTGAFLEGSVFVCPLYLFLPVVSDPSSSPSPTTTRDDSSTTLDDSCYLAICNQSGMVAMYNPTQDILYSPFVDGSAEIQAFTQSMVEESTCAIPCIQKYGTSFSLLEIPESFRTILYDTIQQGSALRLITDANIHHFSAMATKTHTRPSARPFLPPRKPTAILHRRKKSKQVHPVCSSSDSMFSAPVLSTAPSIPEEKVDIQSASHDFTTPVILPSTEPCKPLRAKIGDQVLYNADTTIPPRLWTLVNTNEKYSTLQHEQEIKVVFTSFVQPYHQVSKKLAAAPAPPSTSTTTPPPPAASALPPSVNVQIINNQTPCTAPVATTDPSTVPAAVPTPPTTNIDFSTMVIQKLN